MRQGPQSRNERIGTAIPYVYGTIRMDHPRTTPWAEGTVVPMFGTIADFLVDYLAIPPER